MNFQNNGFQQNNYQKMFELFVQFMNNQNMNNFNNNNFNNNFNNFGNFGGNNNFNNFGGNNNFNNNNFMNNNMNNFNMNNFNMNNFNMNNFNMNNNMNNFNMNNFNMNNNMNNFNMNNNMNNFNMNNFMNNFNNFNNNNFNNNNINMNNFMNFMNNNMNNNIKTGVKNSPTTTNTQNSQEPEALIKRTDDFLTYETDSGSDVRPILLVASSGLRILIKISKNKTLKELFKTYAAKVGVGENVLGTKIVFLFNAETLQVGSDQKIEEIFTKNILYTVTVVDQNNVIGAK